MRRILQLASVCIVSLACPVISLINAQEIGFIEDFALAQDRSAALAELVPGTRDYYYFHCLHFQNTEQLDRSEAMLQAWIKRFGYTQDVRVMRNRQALLNFENDPEGTYEHLQKELNLRFQHQREIPQAQRDLPTSLAPNLIATDTLLKQALSKARNTQEIENAGLELLADQELDKTRRRHLLTRLRTPDYPNVVAIIAADLKERDSGGFGSMPIHNQLTLQQLEELKNQVATLKGNGNFVNAYLRKLAPSADTDWRADREEHDKYLARLWLFVDQLDPAFNSLKANVLYRQLDLDRKDGRYDRERFMRYLQLPRQTAYSNPRLVKEIRSRNQIVNLGADYRSITGLPPIFNDEALVRDYLHHFLVSQNGYTKFRPFIKEEYLKQQFATVKILNGLGDVEAWASMLTPEQYQQLVQRIDLDFSLTNPEFFTQDDQVQIDLFTKNIDKLIVKVFEVNAFNYYRKNQREIDTNINLDGLVPNFEETYTYEDAPALRVKRSYAFDQLTEDGVYIIDFIAGGKSSRALIRRGRLNLVGQPTAAGQQFRVFDNQQQPVTDATLWIAGRKYEAQEDGRIIVPFSSQPSRQAAIIQRGKFSSLQSIRLTNEAYALQAGLYVDRETLIRNEKTKLTIRPRLTVSGIPTAIGLLKDVKLSVISVSLDGISSTKNYDSVELDDNQEYNVQFVVPPRLKAITFNLTGRVENISQNRSEDLAVSRTYALNQIDSTDAIQDVHLVPSENGYWLEVRGKSGEPRTKQPVRLVLKHRDFRSQVSVNLQSDDQGLVQLGPLKQIDWIQVTVAGGNQHQWNLAEQFETQYRSIHMAAGSPILVPAPHDLKQTSRERLSLFEIRNGQYTHDRFEKLNVQHGLIKITGLAPGDYRLHLKPVGQTIAIRVSQGPVQQGMILGQHRQLEIRNAMPLSIANIESAEDEVKVQLSHTGDDVRVHVLATRYRPGYSAFREFARVRDVEPLRYYPSLRRSVYLAGRKIGDEFQYILDRKYVRKFPGNMLDRPSLLLNPWDLRDTSNQVEQLVTGEDFGAVGSDADEDAERAAESKRGQVGNVDFANLDFLANQSMIKWNLKPDQDGVIRIAKDDLGDHQHIRVVAIDSKNTTQRVVNLAAGPTELRDLRLAHGMDPQQHFVQSKQTELLSAESALKIDDLISAKFQYFDDLSDVYRLFLALNPSTELSRFEFILTWDDKSDAEKRELYSKFACHELNYYLKRKDEAFFDQVIRPHLLQKRNPKFMDRFLLGQDLTGYLDPWHFARLNVFERILLAQYAESEAADLVRSIGDLYLMSPTPRHVYDSLYDTAMSFDDLGWSSADKSRLMEEAKKVLPDLQDSGGAARGRFGRNRAYGYKGLDSRPEAPSAGISGRGGSSGESRPSSGRQLQPQNAPAAKGGRIQANRGIAPAQTQQLSRRAGDDDGRARQQQIQLHLGQVRQELQAMQNGAMAGEDLDLKRVEALREKAESLYRRLPKTKEWIENNYYRLPPEQQLPELVSINRFWRDYASHTGGTFMSPYFAESNRTFTEMLLALAVLDLPLEADDHKFDYVDNSMTVTAGGPLIALHQQVRPVVMNPGNTTILVSENFFLKNDRYRHENGVRYDKFVDGEFLAHQLYGAQVVLTNPTSTPRAVDLLIQIPNGAVAASGSHETRTIQLDLDAFSTKTCEYFFYFPTAGEFTHYPAHVSSDEKVLAVAQNMQFTVVDRPAELDKTSWQFVSQNGTDDQVLEFLNQRNLLRHDLSKIAFRMKDKSFFERAIQAIKNRYVYNHVLWSYAILHRNSELAREFLSHDDIASRVGPYFVSILLKFDPVDRSQFYHREYSPLVNARTHAVGAERKILNPQFHAQYLGLMNILAHRNQLSSDDHLVVTYYLLLQDRIEKAIQHFEDVSADDLNFKMQYDYCTAYIAMYLEQPDQAQAIAKRWTNYPVDHWRRRFQAILAQVDEIQGGQSQVVDKRDLLQTQTELASKDASFDFEVKSGQVVIQSQNLSQVQANFYEMDIELLFSRSPFSQDNLDGFSVIRPNHVATYDLVSDQPSQSFDLPEALRNKNVLVELVAGDQVKSKPYLANSMAVQVIDNFGQVRITDEQSGKALPKTYIKVYAKSSNGEVRFHKDGYTDLRGRFDYVSQSNNPLDDVEKYSILILSEEHGATVRQADPPAE